MHTRMHMGSLLAAIVICASHAVHAQSPAPATEAPALSFDQSIQTWLNQPTMTGDWGGLRSQLAQDGFNIRSSYIGNYAYSFAGGRSIGGDYADQFAIGTDIDMDKVAGLTGGIVHLTFNVRSGRNTTADYIGNRINVQEIYGDGQDARLAEMSYEQNLYHGALNLKAGWTVMGDDFARTGILCDFENDAFCAHPVSLPSSSGWSDYPLAHWGGRVRLNLPGDIYVETGVYDVDPDDALRQNGFDLTFHNSTGVLVPIEFNKTVYLGAANMPGHYKIGGYFDSSTAPDTANPEMTYSGRYGGYILADQMVWSFEPGTDRGLVVVADATVSDQRTSPMPAYFVFALIAQGPFAIRPHDFISLGYVRDVINGRTLARENAQLIAETGENPNLSLGEHIVEAGYGIQATPWMQIHPNLQFIGNPGAFSFKHYSNAWVFGSEVKMTF
jgi:porin